ncbi:hypothetical protein CLV25_11189 [Acetobacteroides hydrogenigenes]|uniref:Uncharacterized protein n=1 Tax=Acetobacteroides hydrogenigenes TaxID=979970 RepID=A0A4R2EM50_9BACT|nr:hypothetical protein CLV25_11189 [Acetobacteroides hydrogenigenes]
MGKIFFAHTTTVRIEHLSIRWGACWDNRTNIHWNARRGETFFAPTTTITQNLHNTIHMVGHNYVFV